MTDYFESLQEFRRHMLTTYAGILSSDGFAPKIDMNSDSSGDPVLNVPAGGPSGFAAVFSLTDAGTENLTLSAFYASPLLETGLSELWELSASDDPKEVCRELIENFVRYCRDREFEEIMVPTMINDENLLFFANLLSDRILTEENIYAVGAFMRDGEDLEVAAAAGFYITEDRLVILDVNVLPEFAGAGIDGYLVRYIKKLIGGADIV